MYYYHHTLYILYMSLYAIYIIYTVILIYIIAYYVLLYYYTLYIYGFPGGSAGKEFASNAGDPGLIPGLGRSLGEGNGYPLQYSGLENSMDCIFMGLQNNRTQLSHFHFHFQQLTPQKKVKCPDWWKGKSSLFWVPAAQGRVGTLPPHPTDSQ